MTLLVYESSSLCPQELETEIKQTFVNSRIDPRFINLTNVEQSLKRNINQSLSSLRKTHHYSLVKNTIAEIGWWACFNHEPSKKLISTEEVAPSFSALVDQVNSSEKATKKSKKKKKGFG